MNPQTLSFLHCIARAPHRRARQAAPGATERPGCGGALVQRDAHVLVCASCQTEYLLRAGIPILLPEGVPASQYLKERTIRMYYEMQFWPYVHDLQHYPHLSDSVRGAVQCGHPLSTSGVHHTEPWPTRAEPSGQAAAYDHAIRSVTSKAGLTESFYQDMLNVVRPLITSSSSVVDLGSGLGRMAAEIARMGAAYTIGVDLSVRMVEEAVAIMAAQEGMPIALNVDSGRSAGATLRMPWKVDQCDFIVSDAHTLGLRCERFDVVVCLNVIDRVRDPWLVVREMRRILKPGGYVVISDPYDWDDDILDTPQAVNNMKVLFDDNDWELVREIDVTPFVMRSKSRKVTIYMNHSLVYKRR